MENQKTVKDLIKDAEASIEDVIKFVTAKHIEFEERFGLLKDSTAKNKKIDPQKCALVSAMYSTLADGYLMEYEIAAARLTALQEAYDAWETARTPVAQAEMKKNGEHVTVKAIQSKVAALYAPDYTEWQSNLREAKINKDLLEKRLGIIHDTRYTLNAVALLRSTWDQPGSQYVSDNVLNEADKDMGPSMETESGTTGDPTPPEQTVSVPGVPPPPPPPQ